MESRTAVDRVRALFRQRPSVEYERIEEDPNDDDVRRPVLIIPDKHGEEPFSWFEYSIFVLLGVAMLWAWNMFLAAAPYFQSRFRDDEKILNHFQSAITSVGCVTNLTSMLILSNLQAKANYPKRIIASLVVNVIVFSLLTVSTSYFKGISTVGYLVFTLIMVFTTSVATGLCQNGAFAFASSFGREEYIQAIMTGQAIAGVLPSVAQIASVLAVPAPKDGLSPEAETAVSNSENTKSAFIYFLTATGISTLTFFAVFPLVRKHNRILQSQRLESLNSIEEDEQGGRKVVSMWTLYQKLYFSSACVFVCFVITMFFPVFTQKILSVMPQDTAPRLLQPNAFIPLGFLVWNSGDLIGRLITLTPFYVKPRPFITLILSVLRVGFIPLYLLCNIEGRGAVINSDIFYLGAVQLLFGATNGWLSSSAMMGAMEYVEDGEREATGGFMATNLIAGLMVGSLLSFTAAGVKGMKD